MIFPWLPFGALFLLPFLDPKRPFRLLHLDLVVLLAIGIWPLRASLGTEPPAWTSAVTVAGLIYLLARLLRYGFRPGPTRGPLVPLVPVTWLAVAVIAVGGLRIASLFVRPAFVSDVGVATVLGADRIGKGQGLYDGALGRMFPHGDTYGPVTYLAYVPFEQVWPRTGGLTEATFRAPRSARVAAATFDLLTLLGLFLLGRRLRAGPDGTLLGWALAFAWVSYPYSLLVLRFSFNDCLVGLTALAALLALRSPAGRGALTAVAAATKFAPAALAPLLATGTGERRLRSSVVFAVAVVAVTVAVFVPFIPDGGLHELYDRTIGFQELRRGWVRIWASVPGLDWLQTVCQVLVAGLALLVAFVPRRRTPAQVTALAGALIIAVQLVSRNWSAAYALWFAPLAFAGLFAECDSRARVLAPAWSRRRRQRQVRAADVIRA
jgi:Glycosyltransferase family 87